MADSDQSARSERILIAAATLPAGDQLRQVLRKVGFQAINVAWDVPGAMEMVARTEPDLVLVQMVTDADETRPALCRSLLDRGLPVVCLADEADEEALTMAASVAPYGLLGLPAARPQLLVTVESALRRRAEALLARRCQELSESERRFRAVFEQAGVGVARMTPEGRFLEVNECFARMVGRSSLDLVGSAVADITHPDDVAGDQAALAKLREGSLDTVVRDKRYLRPDGAVVWCRVNANMLRDDSGTPESLLSVAEDVTAQRRAEIELHNQLAFQKSLMDAAVNLIYVQDPQGHYVTINRAFATFIGVTIEMTLGLTAREIFSELIGNLLAHKDREILEQGGVQQFEITLEDASGRARDLVFHRARFDDAAGLPQGIVGVGTDVTDSKRVEKDLRDEQEVLLRILSGIRAGIFIIDPKTHRIEDVNAVAEELCGRPRKELVDQPCSAICWSNMAGKNMSVCPLADSNLVDVEMRLTRSDGRVVPITKTVITAMRRGALRLFEIVFDISERKALERQLSVAQKLESVGELAAGIAHEINTPTQYIGDNLHFLSSAFGSLGQALTRIEAVARRLAEAAGDETAEQEIEAARSEADVEFLQEEAPRALEQSVEGVSRVTSIVSAMKKFSHPGGEEKTAVDFNAAVENTITVAKNEWKYVADVVLDLDPSLPPVFCLPGDFNQVILNILVNAAHAIGEKVKGTTDKGVITIRTETDGDYCKLSVSDTGTGIPEKNRAKIFDPFFTTKEVGKGTGQGLAITHNIVVTKHGGTIDFESEKGKGSTFVVRVPFGSREIQGVAEEPA